MSFRGPDARQAIHIALCAVMLGLSFVLSLPNDTFATSKSYTVMASMATEDHWAGILLGIGVVGVVGPMSHRPFMSFIGLAALTTGHMMLAVCFAISNPVTTASVTYSVLAFLGAYLTWRRTHEGF